MDCCRCHMPIHRDDTKAFLGDRVAHYHERCIDLLRAEVRRLNALIDDAGKPWIRLDPGIPWEGAIDAAMAAACAEIERLRANAEADNSHAMSTAADNERLAARIAELEGVLVWVATNGVCPFIDDSNQMFTMRGPKTVFMQHDGTPAGITAALKEGMGDGVS